MNQAAQEKLLRSQVAVLGVGGLGSACAVYLAAAGVGHLHLVDGDTIKLSNLNRQIIYGQNDVGKSKVEIAKLRLKEINPDVAVTAVRHNFDAHNAEGVLTPVDIVVDCMDTWQDKLLASDVCMHLNKPLVYGGLIDLNFQVYTMIPGKSACLRCAFVKMGLEDPPRRLEPEGVIGAVAGMAGTFQALEVLKFLTGIGTTAAHHLIRFDTLRRFFEDVTDLTANADCPDCGRLLPGK
jgi:molybdopterin/thiamine biosynthesis adenylyltransferase